MTLIHTATPMHGAYYKREDDLEWWQYWRGIKHVWRWHGIPVWTAMRRRDRPMHLLIHNACQGL